MALPQVIERQARSIASFLMPGELAEKLYPSVGLPMPVGPVHGYVASQAVSVMVRHLRAGGQEDFSVDQEMNPYLRRDRGAVPNVFLYLRRPVSKPPGTGSCVVPRDGVPELVMEILSVSTWQNDIPYADDEVMAANEMAFYRACGVAEYWIYDLEACPSPPRGWQTSDCVQTASMPPLHPSEAGGPALSWARPGAWQLLSSCGSVYSLALAGPADRCLVPDDRRTRPPNWRTQGPLGSLPRAIRAFGPASGIKADPILEGPLPLRHRLAQEDKTRVENCSYRDETLGHNEAVLPIRRTPWYPKRTAT